MTIKKKAVADPKEGSGTCDSSKKLKIDILLIFQQVPPSTF